MQVGVKVGFYCIQLPNSTINCLILGEHNVRSDDVGFICAKTITIESTLIQAAEESKGIELRPQPADVSTLCHSFYGMKLPTDIINGLSRDQVELGVMMVLR